ncbi:MAG: phosphate transport system permease protein [Actinomycetota bacterium]|jgi:phosphate transport system permease protein|nr:phosphate transport system permease protein [Actinomycetota bacterium]
MSDAPALAGGGLTPLAASKDASAGGRRGDKIFRGLSGAAGITLLVIIGGIGVFLVAKAIPALRADTAGFLSTKDFLPEAAPPVFGVAALAFGTVLSSALAVVMAVPVALGVALFITQVAHRRLAALLGSLVDLLAAVPSVVYGLWGVAYLNDKIVPISKALHSGLGWIPLFGDTGGRYGRSIFLASVVLAIMILPIIAALSREIFLQVPAGNREAAYALGATRWEMIRTAVLPFSRPGVTAAIMLGLGRALGETIAVALVLLSNFEISAKILGPGGNTIAANIATKFAEYGPTGRGALIASGLVLFVITFVVNLAARGIVYRSARRLEGPA